MTCRRRRSRVAEQGSGTAALGRSLANARRVDLSDDKGVCNDTKTGDQYLERDLGWGVGQVAHRADPRYLMNAKDQTFCGRKGWWDWVD